MASSKNVSIKSVVELKQENERLQEVVNFLEMENFEYALKCNRIENIIANIQAITRDNPAKLAEASEIVLNIMQIYNGLQYKGKESLLLNGNFSNKTTPVKPIQVAETSPRCNKAHVVKPHMVNGHILYIPTINLTRVSELQTRSNTEMETENNTTAEGNSNSTIESNADEMESEVSNAAQEFNTDNEITHIDEVSEPSASKSPSHSTVLSGTFQEVKIYLNQVSQESHNEESRKTKSSSSRRGSKLLRSPRDKYRNGGSSENTKRSKRR